MVTKNIAYIRLLRRIEAPTLPPAMREDIHFPPIPIDSYVRGYYQILRNRSKFIVERTTPAS